MKNIKSILSLLFVLLFLCGCSFGNNYIELSDDTTQTYITLNDNKPFFVDSQITTDVFEEYSQLDGLGRCGVAFANICPEIMPKEERGNIGMVKPSGWHTVKYDCVDGKYLYNRCHLIGYQLAGENANKLNLITGTRYFNVDGMLPFENLVAEYVKKTGNHVLYRVTPKYEGDNLIADGVNIEAYSVEDKGKGVCFNVFVNNIQPDVTIDYATGKSCLTAEYYDGIFDEPDTIQYILNTNTKKFHKHDCKLAKDINVLNKSYSSKSRDALIAEGYSPCKNCNP